jgi:hypothetical protein
VRKALSVLVISALTCASSLFSPQVASAAPADGVGVATNNLLMYFDLANFSGFSSPTLTDLSGNGYNFTTATAGTGSVPTKVGSNGNYLNFTGSGAANGGFLSLSSLPTGSTAWTGLSISFYANMGTPTLVERVFDFGNNAQSDNIWVGVGTVNDMAIEIFNGSASPGWCRSAANAIVSNEWAHWTVTLDGTTCKWYKNNVLSSTNNYSYLPQRNLTLTKNYIGKSNWVDPYFEGGIGDLAIYKGLLSDAERLQNYNAQIDHVAPNLSSYTLNGYETSTAIGTLSFSGSPAYFSLSGTDAAQFSVTSSGVLSFDGLKSFESPSDNGGNRTYDFTVRLTDANGNWNQWAFTVVLRDVIEPSSLTQPILSGTPYKGVTLTITVTPSGDGSSIPGTVTYLMAGKRIPGCLKKTYSGTGNSTCSWKPSTMGNREISVTFTPTNSSFTPSSSRKSFLIFKRATTR